MGQLAAATGIRTRAVLTLFATKNGLVLALIRDLARYHSLVLTVWYLAIVALILQAFWLFWSTLL